MVVQLAGIEWTPKITPRPRPEGGVLVLIENYPLTGTPVIARLGETVIVGEIDDAYRGRRATVAIKPNLTVNGFLLFLDDGWEFTVEPDAETVAAARIVPSTRPRADMF